MLVLDTSAIIGATERNRQTPNVLDLLEDAADDGDVVLTEITLAELRHGVEAASEATIAGHRRRTLRAFGELVTLSISADPAVLDLYARLRVMRPRCSQNDTWIIAICGVAGATLVTEDADMVRLASAVNIDTLHVESS